MTLRNFAGRVTCERQHVIATRHSLRQMLGPTAGCRAYAGANDERRDTMVQRQLSLSSNLKPLEIWNVFN